MTDLKDNMSTTSLEVEVSSPKKIVKDKDPLKYLQEIGMNTLHTYIQLSKHLFDIYDCYLCVYRIYNIILWAKYLKYIDFLPRNLFINISKLQKLKR